MQFINPAKKNETYLYVAKKGDFSQVPEALLQQFGAPVLVMLFNLDGDKPLKQVENAKVKDEIQNKGFYLQLPPPEQSLLAKHRVQLGLDEQVDK